MAYTLDFIRWSLDDSTTKQQASFVGTFIQDPGIHQMDDVTIFSSTDVLWSSHQINGDLIWFNMVNQINGVEVNISI